MEPVSSRFGPSLCVTHDCNLNCSYCYQKHDSMHKMSFDTAKNCVDWIFNNVPEWAEGIELGFIGGEPLLEFELLRSIVSYTRKNYKVKDLVFFATTNGTVLNNEMKQWFNAHKDCFVLGLSLDGTRETHNANRSNSFDLIDFDFFLKNWPEQGVKMTLSEYSLFHLADNIKFIHSLGFNNIRGVNIFEGNFDYSSESSIKILIPQIKELVEFYVENESLQINQMLDSDIYTCALRNREKKKWCGIGVGTIFFDTDGKKYPCPYVTPMTFTENELKEILLTDYKNDTDFIDDTCFNDCYIYPICPTCAGAGYMANKTFKIRNKTTCRFHKLAALFTADLYARRIIKNQKWLGEEILYYTIEAIKKIRELYLPEFNSFFME
jgi:sulfatase maturation enzyme AslB (radical SAM superfamily)